MVKGLDTFKDYFKDYISSYLLIGGTACDIQFNNAGLNFRATKDLDIILIGEAQTPEFVNHFWEFIKLGQYQIKQRSEGERLFYRFTKPKQDYYPEQIELFSRNPDLDLSSDATITPMPIDDYASSLSAILMDAEFYHFTISNSEVIDDIHIASVPSLIALKAAAYLNLKQRKEAGESIDNDDIKKHKNDIVRLTAILTDESITDTPQIITENIKSILDDFLDDPPDIKVISKAMNIHVVSLADLIDQIKQTFNI